MNTKEKRKRRGRRFILALLVITTICALVAVDTAYGDMMMKEGHLCVQVRRTDDAHLLVGFLGREWLLNTEDFFDEIEELQDQAKAGLQGFVENVQFVGEKGIKLFEMDEKEEEDPLEIPVDFPIQTL